ncbi:MAG: flavin reductase [Dehalococcoidia bacterium]
MDTDARKTVLRMIPYGLFVLTADGGSDVGAGTINWVSQMSFEPPLLALGVKKDSKTFAQVKAGGKLGLSFLGSGQGDLAFAFFGDAPIEGDAFVVKGSRIPFSRTAGGDRPRPGARLGRVAPRGHRGDGRPRGGGRRGDGRWAAGR